MKSKKKNKTIPDYIILNVLNRDNGTENDIIDHYEAYIHEAATEPVYSREGTRTGYYYDEDLAQELRTALAQSIPSLREALINNHLEKRPVIVVLENITD